MGTFGTTDPAIFVIVTFKPLNAKKEKPSELKRASQKMISCAIESSNIRTQLDKHVENVLLSLSGDRIGEIIQERRVESLPFVVIGNVIFSCRKLEKI